MDLLKLEERTKQSDLDGRFARYLDTTLTRLAPPLDEMLVLDTGEEDETSHAGLCGLDLLVLDLCRIATHFADKKSRKSVKAMLMNHNEIAELDALVDGQTTLPFTELYRRAAQSLNGTGIITAVRIH